MNPWLIVSDIDGTLVASGREPSPRVRGAVAAAQAAGHVVALATGRIYATARAYAEAIGVEGQPLICCQGALVRQGDEVLYHLPLTMEVAEEAIRFAVGRNLYLCVYMDDYIFGSVKHLIDEVSASVPLGAGAAEIEVLLAALPGAPTKILFVVHSAEEATALLEEATAVWGARAQVVRSAGLFVELTHPRASKGRALLALAERLGIPRGRTLAIGDNHNDLSMIQDAAVGVAMGNADPVLQAAADWVAPSVMEDGLAAAIERFVLGTPA